MPQALTLRHMRWREVPSELKGVPGQAILPTLLAGARAPVQRAQWHTLACQSSTEQIANALTGTWR
jgi:hypothetical protein